MSTGHKQFIARYDSKRKKKFNKLSKKPQYLEYQYESLSDYFTKRTDFYYNLDNGLAKLLADILTNYKLLASDIIDMNEYDLDKKLKFIIKFFKKYSKLDLIDFNNSPKQKQKYEQNKKKAFDYFREIFSLLWY